MHLRQPLFELVGYLHVGQVRLSGLVDERPRIRFLAGQLALENFVQVRSILDSLDVWLSLVVVPVSVRLLPEGRERLFVRC